MATMGVTHFCKTFSLGGHLSLSCNSLPAAASWPIERCILLLLVL
jgi:hypothetical protein